MPINDTICAYSAKMDLNNSVTVAAGTYNTHDFKITYSMHPSYSAGGAIRYVHQFYAENVGLVRETLPFFALSANTEERRLVSTGTY